MFDKSMQRDVSKSTQLRHNDEPLVSFYLRRSEEVITAWKGCMQPKRGILLQQHVRDELATIQPLLYENLLLQYTGTASSELRVMFLWRYR